MSEKPIDVSQWSRLHYDHKHPFWWGIIGLILVECTVVATFLASYFYLWIVNTDRGGWPPEGMSRPDLLYPTINTVLLLGCAYFMYYAGIVTEKERGRKLFWACNACCLLALLVLGLRWLQFQALPYKWNEHVYASFIWVISGFHFLHVASALLGTAVIGWFGKEGYYTYERRLGVQVDTLYWYFVVAAWIPMYVTLYLVERWI